MFLADFPTPLQDHVHHRLAIVKPDMHLDDPYPMDNDIAVAKFLLTGSTFWSTIPPVANTPQSNSHQQTPYFPFQEAAQPAIPIIPFNLPPALRTEVNTTACTVCSWCTEAGHFTHNCANSLEYLQLGNVSWGANSRFYMPDSSPILCVPGGWCFRDRVDYALVLQKSAQQPVTTSTSASSGFTRNPPPHLTAGILHAVFPETPAILDVNLSTFLMMTRSTINSPSMLVVANTKFQPYIAKAWETFQVDRASKDKGRKHACFDGVEIPPHKFPNPDSHWATVLEKMEIHLSELQQVASVTPASDQSSRPSVRASPALIPAAPITVLMPASTSTGQSGPLSSQSGVTGTIPPYVPPTNKSLVSSA